MTNVENEAKRYFITKCYNIEGLKKCFNLSEWACIQRKTPPQTSEILCDAFKEANVVLIFSVNNAHGYHGYALMKTPPSLIAEPLDITDESLNSKDVLLKQNLWHKFQIEWKCIFVEQFGEKCLGFEHTKHMKCLDGTTLVNKARNFQEIDNITGKQLCEWLDNEYVRLMKQKTEKQTQQLSKQEYFFQSTLETPEGVCNDDINKLVLDELVTKIRSMGRIILACPFGSHRYNCNIENSDFDMFIVYLAPTKSILGFTPPKMTVKSVEGDKHDYVILELYRFLELLISGDPRCVECLFLDPSNVYHDSAEYQYLCSIKERFLTKQCVNKYMKDACGAKGTVMLDKLHKSGEALQKPMPLKLCKLFYVIIRLLQNALDICKFTTLHVYRKNDTNEWKCLMGIRSGNSEYKQCRSMVDQLIAEIQQYKDNTDFLTSLPTDLQKHIQNWLINIRKIDLNT